MALSKKDFTKAAKLVNETARSGGDGNAKALVLMKTFADFFEGSAPRFDRKRFIEACGVKEIAA